MRDCSNCFIQHSPPTGRRCMRGMAEAHMLQASNSLISEETIFNTVSNVVSQEELPLSQPAGNQAAQQRLEQVKEVSKDYSKTLQASLISLSNKL